MLNNACKLFFDQPFKIDIQILNGNYIAANQMVQGCGLNRRLSPICLQKNLLKTNPDFFFRTAGNVIQQITRSALRDLER